VHYYPDLDGEVSSTVVATGLDARILLSPGSADAPAVTLRQFTTPPSPARPDDDFAKIDTSLDEHQRCCYRF